MAAEERLESRLIRRKVPKSNCRAVEVVVEFCLSRDDVPFVESG
jgi:hypothetical protein